MTIDVNDIQDVPTENWTVAQEWARHLWPLLNYNSIPYYIVEDVCFHMECSRATFFRKLAKFKKHQTASSLLPNTRGIKKEDTKIDPNIEQVITDNIRKYFLKRPKQTIQYVWEATVMDCHTRELCPPGYSTVLRRSKLISRKDRLMAHNGSRAYRSKNSSARGSLEADYPLQKVQIDHTKADIIIVDTVSREPIGRPIFTVAIDIYSRMILGFHLDIIGPSSWNVSEVLTQLVFKKDEWLNFRNIPHEWPSYGIPECLMLDNGKDFRSKAMTIGAGEYGIQLDYRPPGKAHFGGHVERVIGTFMKRLQSVPGTTFSNIANKGDYDSAGKAVMTLAELEMLFSEFILGRYHNRRHRSLNATPLEKWNEALENGFSPRLCHQNPLKFKIDFLKSESRVVSREGIEFKTKKYWSDITQSLYDNGTKRVQVFPFHSDISKVLIRETSGQIHIVHSKNVRTPHISWSEFNEAKKLSKRFSGLSAEQISDQISRERKLIKKSQKLTNAQRRQNEIDRSQSAHPIRKAGGGEHKPKNKKVSVDFKFQRLNVIGD
ncbi:MAG: hypothetical protein COA43_11510 [Robiginitomaculum sp.]|nr:MAG: hypothetical protein COA43_11510 [Robiginitomaculum sp.]